MNHPYLANGWWTFFWGSGYWLTIFAIVRLYSRRALAAAGSKEETPTLADR
jgi:hypothetical protein